LNVTGLLAHATPAGERAAITCIYLLSIGAEIPFCAMEASSCIADRPTQNAEVELLLRVSNTQGSLSFLSSAIYEFVYFVLAIAGQDRETASCSNL